MKYGFAGIGVILAGLFTLMGMYFVLEGTVLNEEDYHGLNEAMEAAMIDAVDIEYYQKTGELKIIKEKFVENFTRRFVETSAYGKNGYQLEFYDIIESPPKATVRVIGATEDFSIGLDTENKVSYDIINELDAILKYNGTHLYTYELYEFTNSSIYSFEGGNLVGIYSNNIQIPEELRRVYNIGSSKSARESQNKCKVVNIEYVEPITKANAKKAAETYVKYDTGTKKYQYQDWYFGPNMTNEAKFGIITDVTKLASGNNSNFCEIESVQCFEFTSGGASSKCKTSSCSGDCLRDVKATFTTKNCMNNNNRITGFKYRVTWECTQ